MAIPPLKSIKLLAATSNIKDFAQYRELNRISFFQSLWRSILELLLINNYYEIGLIFILNSIYYYKQSHNLDFEKKHNKTITKLTETLINCKSFEVKNLLSSVGLLILLNDLANFRERGHHSVISSIENILKYLKIEVHIKTDYYKDIIYGSLNPLFAVNILQSKKKIFFLYPRKRMKIKQIYGTSDILTKEVITFHDTVRRHDESDDILEIEDISNTEILKKSENLPEFAIEKYKNSSILQPSAFCGAILCMNCMKKLKRSSHFLINQNCCAYNIYNSKSQNLFSTSIPIDNSNTCIFCMKTCRKPEILLCICCFLDKIIYNNTLKASNACKNSEIYYWIDINYGNSEDFSLCGFCDQVRNKIYLCSACATCGDQVCIACLRRNPFIVEGVCTPCSTKRVIAFNNI